MIGAKHLDLSLYRSILCLNGDLPDATFFASINLPLIAADGAADRLVALGLTPALIIGDLDSVSPDTIAKTPFLFCPEQDSNDYQKALHYLQKKNLLPAIVLGINGGHIDHILNNIAIFLTTDSLLYAPPIIGSVLKENTTHTYTLPLNTKISLFGIPKAKVTSRGLKWELDQTELTFPGHNSCFNRTQTQKISLAISDGDVLLLQYLNPTYDAGSD